MREKFGGKKFSRSRTYDYEQFCYDLSYIPCANYIVITIRHVLIIIKEIRSVLQKMKNEGAWLILDVNSNMLASKST